MRILRVRRLNQHGSAHLLLAIPVILVVGAIGVYVLSQSNAATASYYSANCATKGTYASNVAGGNCVKGIQALLDGLQHAKYKLGSSLYYTVNQKNKPVVNQTFAYGKTGGTYLVLNGTYNLATQNAITTLTNDKSVSTLNAGTSNTDDWQILCTDIAKSGIQLATNKNSGALNFGGTNTTNGATLTTIFTSICGVVKSVGTTSGGGSTSGGSSGTSSSGSTASSRSPYTWPFSWDSIWNIPIASTASYAAANISDSGTYEDSTSADYDSIDPSYPVVTLENARLANGNIGAVSVYGDPAMTANGGWNTCSAFLGTDKRTVYQGQTTQLTAKGNPQFGGNADVAWPTVDIESTGISGCHGGSSLSGLGGTLTLSDITQSGPITHALKIALDGYLNYSNKNGGYRWPATTADYGYNISGNGNYYGGSNTNLVEGSLLALPRSIKPSSFSNPTVAKLAQAMQDYGVYPVDTTATSTYGFSTLIANYNATSTLDADLCITSTPCGHPSSNTSIFSSQLDTLIKDLQVITNNTASTPGGGSIGASRCAPYAPKFTDGTGTPPAVSVVSCQ